MSKFNENDDNKNETISLYDVEPTKTIDDFC